MTTRGDLKQYKQLNRLVSNGMNLLLYQKMVVQQQSLRQSIPTNQMTSFLHSAYLEYAIRILDLENFKILKAYNNLTTKIISAKFGENQ